MEKDIKYILMNEKEIDNTVARIAAEIDRDYKDAFIKRKLHGYNLPQQNTKPCFNL